MQNENSDKQQDSNRPRKDDDGQSNQRRGVPEKKFSTEKAQAYAQNSGIPQPAQGQKPRDGQDRDQAGETGYPPIGHAPNDDRGKARDHGQGSARPGSNQNQREQVGAAQKSNQR